MPDIDPACSFCIAAFPDEGDEGAATPPTAQHLAKLLESNDDQTKLQGMRELLLWMHNGTAELLQSYEKLFMTVIRFAAPSRHHEVRKLVQLYWEGIPQVSEDGSMRQEMILVSNFIRNDLQHPNEYVRGASLRSLAKMCSPQLLSTVADCFPDNLTHNNPYVRRNAAMCIYAIAQRIGKALPQTLPELESMAVNEVDVAAQRAAILALIECDPVRATQVFLVTDGKTTHLGETCHLAILHLIKVVFKLMFQTFPPTDHSSALSQLISKDRLTQHLLDFLDESPSDAVVFEAATTLLWITDFAPTACKNACKALVKVLLTQKDINVRLAILDKLMTVTRKCVGVFDEFVIDVLRVLSSPSTELRQKVLMCALPVITGRSVNDATAAIKTELVKSMDGGEQTHKAELQKQLVQAMRFIGTKFPDVAGSVIELLLDFLSESDSDASVQVGHLVRELVVSNVALRHKILTRLIESLGEIGNARTLRMCVWVLGDLCDSAKMREDFIEASFETLSPMPFRSRHVEGSSGGDAGVSAPGDADKEANVTVRTIILPDGAYGTENVYESGGAVQNSNTSTQGTCGLRNAIAKQSNSLLAAIVCVALTKVAVRKFDDDPSALSPTLYNKVLLIIGSLLKYFSDHEYFGPKSDVAVRLRQCLRTVIDAQKDPTLVYRPRKATNELARVIALEREALHQEELNIVLTGDTGSSTMGLEAAMNQADDMEDLLAADLENVICFRTLSGTEHPTTVTMEQNTSAMSSSNIQLDYAGSLDLAMKGVKGMGDKSALMMSMLRPKRAKALSGSSDPIYVECVMQVNHLDLIIELLIVNQTHETLQNVAVHLGTHGDLKVLERPQPVTLVAGEEATVFATIRLASTEAGVIFGYCGYERKSAVDKEYFTLSEIQIDLLDCIQRAYIGDMTFRTMWAEFEWENKITIQSQKTDVFDFLSVLLKQTKMSVVGLFGDNAASRKLAQMRVGSTGDFLEDVEAAAVERYIKAVRANSTLQNMAKSRVFAVNLCSKSIFGEDALVNLSLERNEDGKLIGAARIRSRTQGIALSLGDCIAATQRAQAAEMVTATA